MNPIQLFVPTFRTQEVLAEIAECLDRGWTGNGYKTLEFENAWKDYTGLPNAHFLNSATAGLELAMYQLRRRYGWVDRDEVITTPLTFVSTNHAIYHSNLQPIFADVDEYLCLNPKSVEDRITKRTKAIIFVGMGGNGGQFEEIRRLCVKHNLKLILDAAHMTGTRIFGRHAGWGCDVSIFSFQAVKNLPTADSGMICWADDEMDTWSRKLSWLGINKSTYDRSGPKGYSWEYDVTDVGWKYHGNSIMAAMGLVGLKYVDTDNELRRRIAEQYDKGFAGCEGVSPVATAPNCQSSRHLYQVLVRDRNELIEYLKERNIGSGVHYISNQRYQMYSHAHWCKYAEHVTDHVLSLPMHLRLTPDDINRIIETVRAFQED